MSRDASLTLFFGEGDCTFRLAVGELERLQEVRDAGPERILNRLSSDEWRTQDVREVLRQGLIGGGMKPEKAASLVARYVDEVPDWAENKMRASIILGFALIGPRDEEAGKETGEGETSAPLSPMENGASPTSTEPQPLSA